MRKFFITCVLSIVFIRISSCGDDISGPVEYENPQYPDSLVQSLFVGSSLHDIVAPYGTDDIYVTCAGERSVMAIDLLDFSVDTIRLDAEPGYLVATPDGGRIYIASYSDQFVYVLDTELNEIIQTVSTDLAIKAMEISSAGDYVYVGCMSGRCVHVIRTQDNTVTDVLELDKVPTCLEAIPGGEYVYIGNSGVKQIRAIRTSDNTLMDPIDTEEYPKILLASADGEYLFIFNKSSYEPRYEVIRLTDGESMYNIRTLQVYMYGIRLPGTNVAVLVRQNDDKISILNLDNRIFAPTVTTGPDPIAVAASQDGSELYVIDGLTSRIYFFR